MLNLKKILQLAMASCVLAVLAGCGGGSDSVEPGKVLLTCNVPQVPNSAGTACVAPKPIKCPAPTVPDARNESCVIGVDPTAPAPVVMAGPGQAVLFYKRADGNYNGYKLHTWNDETCSAYTPSSIAAGWADGLVHNGVDPNYGAYWLLNLLEGVGTKASDCGNFIIHIGTDDAGKELGGGNMKLGMGPKEVAKFSRMGWTFSGVASVFDYPLVSLGVQISDSAAHWLDTGTFVWNAPTTGSSKIKLHSSAAADLAIDSDTLTINGDSVELTPTALTDEQKAKVPHLASWPAYKTTLTADQAKNLVKNQLVLAAYDSANKLTSASHVQAAKVLDDLYTKAANDADEAVLGVVYEGSNIKTSVWAPTARSVNLKVYNAAKTLTATHAMTVNAATGVWSYSGAAAGLNRSFYRFELQVYHPLTKKVETVLATDPYSVNTATNGRYSQFVNLADADTKPANWDSHEVPAAGNPEDIVIYEGHIRDFSVRDMSVTAANRGKYLAFTEMDSAPVQHLKTLADSGLTHFHMLPATDMATVNEDVTKRVDLNNTVADLCKISASAPVCLMNASTKLEDVMKGYQNSGENAQALAQAMRGTDSFNWGYDPHHFNVPEGSYASTPEGVARVKEMRAMNQALHAIGLRVVLDVVYNHTSSSGLFDNSVFDKIVPGYFHRYNPVSGLIERSTCCENTATEHAMMRKFVSDSLVTLAKEYKFDGFRFDIMGHHPKADILAAREAVKAVDADTYFYGEGWNFGEVANDARFVQARQANLAGTEVGSFNDRIRDSVRSAALFANDPDVGNLQQQNFIEIGMAGTLKDYILKDYMGNTGTAGGVTWNGQPAGYATDPADIINYVSKHDNEAIWDKLQLELGSAVSIENRVRIHNISLAIPLLSQGIPFLQMGDDLLRSKSMDRNSYDAGDWFNFVDFTKQSNNWNVGLPLAQDNQASWEIIKPIANNPNTAAAPQNIEFASDVFNEFLQIRSSSSLFRLTTGADVMARVGLHNIGKTMTQGLIVLSIDDGIGLADLDPAHDAVVVVVNGTNAEKTHKVRTAQGFELHQVLQDSADTVVQDAHFNTVGADGEFVVPAYTAAVFVKPQVGAQGVGLKADATMGAPDIAPYGLTTVYVRGGMNGWGEADAFAYDGAGVYSAKVTVTAGDHEFKVASSDWSTVDFGAKAGEQNVILGTPQTLAKSGPNLKGSFATTSTYVFTLNATVSTAPVLTVSEYVPYGATKVFLRGGMNDWTERDPFTYNGLGQYSVQLNLAAGDYEFKVASSDWATVDFGGGADGQNVAINTDKVLAKSGPNLKIKITDAAAYKFAVSANDSAAPVLKVNKVE
ncbi:pullulanase-type alpha-1,6-glucosidase [Rheinheimera riviphila]|uniref:pullulanase n=1 Tax=Rheinheimera riviphila TaxID=1834037 RepID=A0A437QBC3_9GAMM|nr:pullulanase-type alpha-1,6-glucosidase [Rheinheimera riviphila]RVU31862.1 pullulanase-type alpha-1,6-glucosidase [Rheinheimera riviphila]